MAANQSKRATRRVGFLLESTTRVVKLSFTKLFKNLGIDITPEQWVILDALYQKSDLTQNELAVFAYKDAPTISRIIDKLEDKKFVKRKASVEDRRKTLVALTKKGKTITETCYPEVYKLREQSWKGLTDKDYESLQKILEKVFGNSDDYV